MAARRAPSTSRCIYWSAKLGALEALESGDAPRSSTTTNRPTPSRGRSRVIAAACAEVGVRVGCAYGVTDRTRRLRVPAGHDRRCAQSLGENGGSCRRVAAAWSGSTPRSPAVRTPSRRRPTWPSSSGSASTSTSPRARRIAAAPARLARHATDDWLLAHGVHLPDDHGLRRDDRAQPPLEPQQRRRLRPPGAVRQPGRARHRRHRRRHDREFRLAYARGSGESDVTASPETPWAMVGDGAGTSFPRPERSGDVDRTSRWNPGAWPSPPVSAPVRVEVDGGVVWRDGAPTRVDPAEVRAKAAEPPSAVPEDGGAP